MKPEEFYQRLQEVHGITLTEVQKEQFHQYFQLLVEWNEKMNLTAITDEEGVYLKHFYDSLALGFHHELSNQTLCDVGAGAGFPSIPLKIVFPDLKVTIVDSLNKRITFLNTLVETLGLTDVQYRHHLLIYEVSIHRPQYDKVQILGDKEYLLTYNHLFQ